MTEEQRNRFEALLQTGFRISSTKSLEHGLLLYRSNFRAFAVFAMLLPLASTLIGLLPLGLAGFLITSLLVAPVLNAGYYLVADRLARGERPPFATFFDAREHALPLILNNLLAAAILAVVMIPTYLVFQKAGFFEWYQEVAANPTSPPDPPMIPSGNSTVVTLNLIPLVYLAVGYAFAFPLILLYQASPWQALELSRRLVTKQWASVFFLLLTFFFMLFLASFFLAGLMAFSVALANLATFGIFLLLPWAYCSLYVAFLQATAPMNQPPPES